MPLLKCTNTLAESQGWLAESVVLQHLDSLSCASDWSHCDGHFPACSLQLVASVGSPFQMESNGHSRPHVFLGHDGHSNLNHGSKCYALAPGTAVILPGQSWSLVSERGSSVTLIAFDPLRLVTIARTMAPSIWEPPPAIDSPLNNGLSLPKDGHHQGAALLSALNMILPAFGQVGLLGESFLESFLLEQQLYRLLAALVFPSICDNLSTPGVPPGPATYDKRLEKVIDFVNLNLDQPLSLSVLVEQSNYSRRSLHYAFKERFGCSPMQWIRQQRMTLALQLLQQAQPTNTTVRKIARNCGYNSLGRFYVDFQRTFGCKPSNVLRNISPETGDD